MKLFKWLAAPVVAALAFGCCVSTCPAPVNLPIFESDWDAPSVKYRPMQQGEVVNYTIINAPVMTITVNTSDYAWSTDYSCYKSGAITYSFVTSDDGVPTWVTKKDNGMPVYSGAVN